MPLSLVDSLNPLEPAFKENNIAIAMACNEAYIPYFCVALGSIIDQSSSQNNYDILLLSQENISEDLQKIILEMIKEHPNFSLRFVLTPSLTQYDLCPADRPIDLNAWSRLFLPLLYAGSKILYLDIDTIAREDLANLYQIDLGDHLAGAVLENSIFSSRYNLVISYQEKEIYAYDYIETVLRLPIEEYFNSGVLLLDLEKIRETGLAQKLIDFEAIKNSVFYFHEQDWLNKLLAGKTLLLDSGWNQMVAENLSINLDQGILHYSSLKPWHNLHLDPAPSYQIWWETAGKTHFYQEMRDLAMAKEKKPLLKKRLIKFFKPFFPVGVRMTLLSIHREGLFTTLKKLFVTPQENFEIPSLTTSGITTEEREPELIVTLTSYPPRIPFIHITLSSLLNQNLKPNKVVLWLNENEFPRREKNLPQKVLDFKKYGLTIEWTNQNIRSYKKIIPSLTKYPEAILVTADDDAYYSPDWLAKLYESYLSSPQEIHAHLSARLSRENEKWLTAHGSLVDYPENSFLNIFENVGGVLYPPYSLDPEVIREDLFMSLTPNNDDIWLWIMSIKNKTMTQIIKNNVSEHLVIERTQKVSLVSQNHGDLRIFKELNTVLAYYPEIYETLRAEIERKPKLIKNLTLLRDCPLQDRPFTLREK